MTLDDAVDRLQLDREEAAVEVLNLADAAFSRDCEERLSAGISMLASAPGDGERNTRWRIRTNVRLERSAAS